LLETAVDSPASDEERMETSPLSLAPITPSQSPTSSFTLSPSPIPTPSQTSTRLPSVTPLLPTTTPYVNDQGYPVVVGSQGHLMVRIPAGSFTMGLTEAQWQELCSLTSEPCDDPEWWIVQQAPAREVMLTHDYWVDVYEVTNGQYQACVDAGVCPAKEYTRSGHHDPYYGNPEFDSFPVLGVSWSEADTFCQEWRGGRLPSEAEWEYAARGTDGRLWPWGNARPTLNLLNYLPSTEIPAGYYGDAAEVGSRPDGASPFGLHDMAGNAYEWVADWYGNYPEAPLVDPQGPDGGRYRVVRGGSFNGSAIEASTTFRWSILPNSTSSEIGIRCVRDVSP
jgi:serine/threonine-protein kinase